MIVALSTSVLPAISAAITRRDALGAQTITKSVIRITILFALPCTVGLAVLAGPILQLILNNSLAKDLLRTISIAIVFVSIVQVTNAVLQAYGKMHIPVINMIIGGIVKIAFNYYFIGIASINIEGAPLGTIACYFVIAMLNLIYIARLTKAKFEKADFIFKPLFSAVGMGVIATFSVNAMLGVGIGEKIAVLPAIAIGAIVYMLLILTTGGITKSDVEMMPAGKRVAETLGKLHLLKG
jgi:stage V sporulation protein B